MSVGFLLASEADYADARDIAVGFGLDAIGAAALGSQAAAVAALQSAANVGIIVSNAATRDAAFVALLLELSTSLRNAQLILATADARSAFPFLPETWPAMSLADAQSRADELVRRRNAPLEPAEPPRAHPLPPNEPPVQASPEPPAHAEPEAPPIRERAIDIEPPPIRERPEAAAPEQHEGALSEDAEGSIEEEGVAAPEHEDAAPDLDDGLSGGASDSFGADAEPAPTEEQPAPAPQYQPPAAAAEPPPAPDVAAPAPGACARLPTGASTRASAPADATAFAPKKLRRGTPELVRIVIHQPDDLKAVIKAAKQIDPRTDPAPSGMKIGEVALGSSVGVSLEVRGAACDGALQRRVWTGEPLDFNFSAEPDADVKQAVFLARVFVNDAQIGVLAFTRPIGGASAKAHSAGDSVRLKRHKRVFLSYSSKDRETVAAIATAYEAAGVEHFFDRTSLKSGEEWSPRLRREIERADLFHLCWSKAAATSEWVEKEAEHALTRRRRSKKPDITVQMLDGPPWAPHPPHLDSINFDDFVRAAIVGYARGDGGS
jgi:hypothetical protein